MTEISPDQCAMELKRILELSLECAIRLDELLHDEYGALATQDMSALAVLNGGDSGALYSAEGQETERFEQRSLALV